MFLHTYPLTIHAGYGLRPSEDLRELVPEGESFQFIVRGITRREFRQWRMLYDDVFDLQDRVLQEAVIQHPKSFHDQPWDWDCVYAGVVESVVQTINSISGFEAQPDPRCIEEVEAYFDGEEAVHDLMIMMALKYRLEELMELDATTWYKLIGQARRALTILDLNVDAFTNPNAPVHNTRQGRPVHAPPQMTPGGPAPGGRSENFVFTSE